MEKIKSLYEQREFKLNPIVVAIFIVALLGLVDASYLTIKHYSGGAVSCSVFEGCDAVASSKYSLLFGLIPVSLLGVVYYLTMMMFAVIYSFVVEKILVQGATVISGLGFMASLYFTYLQFFVIEALCMYCLFSAGTSTLLFLLTLFLIRNAKKVTISTEITL